MAETLCERCACQSVCAIYRATGGVPKCKYLVCQSEARDREEAELATGERWVMRKLRDDKWGGYWYRWYCSHCGEIRHARPIVGEACFGCGKVPMGIVEED